MLNQVQDLALQLDSFREKLFDRGDSGRPIYEQVDEFLTKHCKITDPSGNRTNLIFNPVQTKIHDAATALEMAGKPVFIVEWKIRQIGSTTYWVVRGFARAYLLSNYVVLLAAHRDDTSKFIYHKARFAYHSLPESLQTARALISPRPAQDELRFAPPHNSIIISKTAGGGGAGIGHGFTINYALLSEIALYPNAVAFLKGVGNANHYLPGNERILETTAEGEDACFYPVYCDALEGKNEYTPLDFDLKSYRTSTVRKVPDDFTGHLTPSQDEIAFKDEHDLDDETFRFLVYMKHTPECGNQWTIVNSQYPVNWKVATSSTGRPSFDRQVLDDMLDNDVCDPLYRCNLAFDCEEAGSAVSPVKDVEVPRFQIWQEPLQDRQYIFSGDPARGVKADYHLGHIYMIDDGHLTQVAHYHSNTVNMFRCALDWLMLAQWYGAYVIIEVNNTGLAIMQYFQHGFPPEVPQQPCGYGSLYYPVAAASKEQEEIDRIGFLTGRTTKPGLIARCDRAIADRLITIKCRRTIDELRGWHYDPERDEHVQKHKHIDATLFHDDEIVATMLGVEGFEGWKRSPKLMPRGKEWNI